MRDRIAALITRLGPVPICDDCIVERLHLTALDEASQRTHELAGQGGYERSTAECGTCGQSKSVIRRRQR